MQHLFSLTPCFLLFALASCDVSPWSYDIGDGLVLVQTAPEFKLTADNSRCEHPLIAIDRGEIPATSEIKTETVIVQDGSFEVVVTPIKYKRDGSVKTAAKVRIRRIPSVSKQLNYLVVKTPSGELQRVSDVGCKPIIRRVVWTPATYKINDKSGTTIKEFETAEALAEYINSK